jgi:hypothetical protein
MQYDQQKKIDKRLLWKTRFLKTSSVASIILTTLMERGFAETSTNKVVYYGKLRDHFFRSHFENKNILYCLECQN